MDGALTCNVAPPIGLEPITLRLAGSTWPLSSAIDRSSTLASHFAKASGPLQTCPHLC
jgi:hypothetical protein